jgi:hypothetical protein
MVIYNVKKINGLFCQFHQNLENKFFSRVLRNRWSLKQHGQNIVDNGKVQIYVAIANSSI